MKSSKYLTILIILFILAYLLISQYYLLNYGNLYSFVINPIFYILLSILLKLTIKENYKTTRFKKDIIQYVLITVLSYSLLYLLSGLLTGFGKNPYSSSIRGITINLYAIGIPVFAKEYIRYKLINNVYKKDKKLIFVLIVITFTISGINLPLLLKSSNIYYLFKQIFYKFLPYFIKNILFTFLAMHTDFWAAFLYEILYYFIIWLAPVLPNSPWVLEALIDSVFPILLLVYTRYFIHKKDRFNLNTISKPVNPSGIIPLTAGLVLVIWFALGIFPIKPVGVATGSMEPEINIGDLVIIKKCNPNNIELYDIIEYQLNGYTVIHRVIQIDQKNGEFFYLTKGDNNRLPDKELVREDQLLGKVILKIPYVARPTVWLHNLNSKTIDVETGN